MTRSISHSETGMEQYHALLLAKRGWNALTSGDRREVLAAIEYDHAHRQFIRNDYPRAKLADEIGEFASSDGSEPSPQQAMPRGPAGSSGSTWR